MTIPTAPPDFAVDLLGGVVPISKAASALAALIKRRRLVVITQKGVPTGVLLPIELFVALRERVERTDPAHETPPDSEDSEL